MTLRLKLIHFTLSFYIPIKHKLTFIKDDDKDSDDGNVVANVPATNIADKNKNNTLVFALTLLVNSSNINLKYI